MHLVIILVLLVASPGQTQQTSPAGNAQRSVAVDGSVVLVDQAPYFAKIIQHNGEPFTYLRQLGFNTIQLRGPATDEQLKEAAALRIWLVCPPPPSAGRIPISAQHDSVLAWSVTDRGSTPNEVLIRERIRDIRESDTRGKRPVFAHCKSNWQAIGAMVDILGLGSEPIGTNFPLNRYSDWIRNRAGQRNQPTWVDIQTEVPVSVTRQLITFLDAKPELPLEHEQIKFMFYEAVTAGARGIRFLSRSRLDQANPAAQFRVQSIQSVLLHADQLSPWTGGGLLQKIDSSQASEQVHSIRLAGSNLLLAQRTTGFEQWSCGDISPGQIAIGDSITSVGDRIHAIDENGIRLLAQPSTSSRSLVLPSSYVDSFLITNDPLLIQAVNEQSISAVNIPLRMSLTRQGLGMLSRFELLTPVIGQGFPAVGAARQQAETSLRNAEQIANAGDTQTALERIDMADSQIAATRRSLLEQQRQFANGNISAPLLTHFSLLPHHLLLAQELAGNTWNPNSLPGGDFENLGQMTQAGWKNRRNQKAGLSTQVELTREASVGGDYGLKLSVNSGSGLSTVVGTDPLRIESAGVTIRKGQLIRIHGYVNLPQPLTGGEDGLRITDSIAGPGMATRVLQTGGWQQFTIYRFAPRNGEISIEFAMSGVGQAMLDEVTIRTMDRNATDAQALSNRDTQSK